MEQSSFSPHPDLLAASKLAFEPSGMAYTNLIKEKESAEYGASTFEMNHKRITFRVGKVTPTKNGQFVTLWKRIGEGAIQPFDLADPIDLFVISVRTATQFGQFIFPKATLFERGVVAKEGTGGRRAMRLYPPWDKPESPQATKTQAWQLPYFFEIQPAQSIDTSHVRKLFAC